MKSARHQVEPGPGVRRSGHSVQDGRLTSDHLLVKPKQSTGRPAGSNLRAVLFAVASGQWLVARVRFNPMGVEDFAGNQASFAARYASMSDAELIELAAKSWELSDAAWDALEDELDRRGIEAPAPEEVPQIEALEKRDLVLLRRFRDLPEALLAKGMLESTGIPCSLADDNMVRLDWFISNLLGGVKLMVDAEDFAEASRVLNEPAPEEFEDEE